MYLGSDVVSLLVFQAKGADIGDVYLASDVAFHDRRIPIPVSVLLCLVVFFFCGPSPIFLQCDLIQFIDVLHY